MISWIVSSIYFNIRTMKINFILVSVLWLIVVSSIGQGVQLQSHWPATNGQVYATQIDEDYNRLYLGGQFTMLGKNKPYGIVVDNQTGEVDLDFPEANSAVIAVCPDGDGGWFVGGDFTSIGGTPCERIAHIDVNGTLTDWNPGANSTVRSILVIDSKVYVGGDFTVIGGENRNRLASIDLLSQNVTDWN